MQVVQCREDLRQKRGICPSPLIIKCRQLTSLPTSTGSRVLCPGPRIHSSSAGPSFEHLKRRESPNPVHAIHQPDSASAIFLHLNAPVSAKTLPCTEQAPGEQGQHATGDAPPGFNNFSLFPTISLTVSSHPTTTTSIALTHVLASQTRNLGAPQTQD